MATQPKMLQKLLGHPGAEGFPMPNVHWSPLGQELHPGVCTAQVSVFAGTCPERGQDGHFPETTSENTQLHNCALASERTESRGLRFHQKLHVIKCFNHTALLAGWGVGGWFSLLTKVVGRWQHLSLQNSVISASDWSKVELRERCRNYLVRQMWQDLELPVPPIPIENWVILLLKCTIYIIW